MESSDALIEAVKNSIQALSSYVHLTLDYKRDSVEVSVLDDGKKGVEKKGEGKGIVLMKEMSTSFEMKDCSPGTLVSFTLDLDKSMRDIAPTVASLFNYTEKLVLVIMKDGKTAFTYSTERRAESAKEIGMIKELIRKEEKRWLS